MQELKKSEILTSLPILREKRNDLTFSYSVIHQIIPGRVFVDNNICPKTALISTDSGLYRIVGNEYNDYFNKKLSQFLFEKLAQSENRFTLFSSSDTWERIIDTLLGDRLTKLRRISFEFNIDKSICGIRWREKIPAGFTIEGINKDLIRQCEKFDDEYYKEYWGSVDKFINNGFGYCILYNGKIVSICTSIYVGGGYAEIDIFTHPDFRGKGLGILAAAAFIEHCIENGIKPSWDCAIDNLQSCKLASRLGFMSNEQYSIYIRNKTHN